jgi:putative transposase
MDVPNRKRLPHDVPLWIDPQQEIYFLTFSCAQRGGNQLARPDLAPRFFETIQFRQEHGLWWCHLFLLMPDHAHALMSFPPSGKCLQAVISKWKEWTAKDLDIEWQRDFFEHRLRGEVQRREKANYILANPIRKSLVADARAWPFVWFPNGPRPYGWPTTPPG